MLNITVATPQIGDDETLEEIDGFFANLTGRVEVFGIIDEKAMALRVGGYRMDGRRPLLREDDPDDPDGAFKRTHYNSMFDNIKVCRFRLPASAESGKGEKHRFRHADRASPALVNVE